MARTVRSAVVDASVFAKWFVGEPSEAGEKVRHRFAKGDIELYAPAQILFEVCNAVWKRRDIPDDVARRLCGAAVRSGLTVVPLEDELAEESVGVARRRGISFYDAVYVALAKQARMSLITADEVQRKVAEGEGVAIVFAP